MIFTLFSVRLNRNLFRLLLTQNHLLCTSLHVVSVHNCTARAEYKRAVNMISRYVITQRASCLLFLF